MGELTQAVAPRDNFKASAFKTASMKAPDSFDDTQAHKLRGFSQSCQLIFPNYAANFFSDRKKVLYSTLFLTDPSYLLKNWQLFETQLFTLLGDPNEVRKAEQELDNSRMKESGHVSLYIADFRSLMSRIRDLGERAYIHVFRRGLASRPLDQLASYPGNFDTHQELMDITMRDRKRRVVIMKRSLLSLDPTLQVLINTHLQKGLTIRRIRRARNIRLQRKSPILLSSTRTIN
ncbi:hypothetical protein O181_094634 [Austropuccinia psidii MF-1]|uniref:Retrotransposon gag domain-containing protein n=1 Tax=Austropuccinia psidii MF-1 TaxID=1389203 RepID=A0A9Q3J3T3_9BASI|nr:hypothetical protein [Austropuccinia psidii MF-1]